MTYACLTCVLIFVLLVLLECPAILVSAGQAGQKSGQTGHLVTLPRRGAYVANRGIRGLAR